MFSIFTPSNAQIRETLRQINYDSGSQQENFRSICHNNNKNLFDILTDHDDFTDAVIHELKR